MKSFRIEEKGLNVRPVREEDCRILWEWRNDQETRETAFETAEIPYENHQEWFNSRILSKSTKIFIAEDINGNKIGQVRFDSDAEKNAEVDIFIAKTERGKGYGTVLLKSACQYGFGLGLQKFTAHIKKDNAASIALFTKAGFTNNGELTFKNTPAIEFILEKTISQ